MVKFAKISVFRTEFQLGKVLRVISEGLGSDFDPGSNLEVILGGLGVNWDFPERI